MEKIDCNHSEKDRGGIEGVEIPLSGDDPTVPAVCEFDRSVDRSTHVNVSEIMGASKRTANLMTTRNVLIPIPMRRSLMDCGIRTEPSGCPWTIVSLEPGARALLRAGRSV